MELFKNINVDWMGKVWLFLSASLVLLVVGWFSVLQHGGFTYSIDFTGGTLIKVKTAQKPDVDRLRDALKQSLGAADVTRFDAEEKNLVQIRMKKIESEDSASFQNLGQNIYDALHGILDKAKVQGKQDLNRVGIDQLAATLSESRVLENMGRLTAGATIEETQRVYRELAETIVNHRTDRGGLITDIGQLGSLPGISNPVLGVLKQHYYPGSFTVLSVDSVGPKIGKELQDKATKAVFFSLLGMLVYIALRFKFAFGVGAVIALFHDVLITMGLMSLLGKEISLIVVAGFLTLVGYSINDTIVVFDRIRENIKLNRADTFRTIINKSINQTLSRTVITSGLTFISVFCLWLLGGETLDGFSFVLVIGIIIGTYSSIAVASPLTYLWMRYLGTAKEKKVYKFA
ncbi:MAG: protein translocase subunit SecF [Acidobacteria bacterium]|nr:protein translocase subunit SecF [Acidobacteriota bacterium]